MLVYRVERGKYLGSTLQGIGAGLSEGFRWNSLNTRLVYTSESRALAALEIAVHLDLNEDLPTDRHFVEINIPDSVEVFELKIQSLPKNWDSRPPILDTQFVGDDFVRDNMAAVLKVPSCIIPQEFNYLINPLHPEAEKIKVVSTYPMMFDNRLKKPGTG